MSGPHGCTKRTLLPKARRQSGKSKSASTPGMKQAAGHVTKWRLGPLLVGKRGVFQGCRGDLIVQQGRVQGEQGTLPTTVQAHAAGTGRDEQIEHTQYVVQASSQIALPQQKAVAVEHVVHAIGMKESRFCGRGDGFAQAAHIESVERVLSA